MKISIPEEWWDDSAKWILKYVLQKNGKLNWYHICNHLPLNGKIKYEGYIYAVIKELVRLNYLREEHSEKEEEKIRYWITPEGSSLLEKLEKEG